MCCDFLSSLGGAVTMTCECHAGVFRPGLLSYMWRLEQNWPLDPMLQQYRVSWRDIKSRRHVTATPFHSDQFFWYVLITRLARWYTVILKSIRSFMEEVFVEIWRVENAKIDHEIQNGRLPVSFCLWVQETFLCVLMFYMCIPSFVHIGETFFLACWTFRGVAKPYGHAHWWNSYHIFRSGLLTYMWNLVKIEQCIPKL